MAGEGRQLARRAGTADPPCLLTAGTGPELVAARDARCDLVAPRSGHG